MLNDHSMRILGKRVNKSEKPHIFIYCRIDDSLTHSLCIFLLKQYIYNFHLKFFPANEKENSVLFGSMNTNEFESVRIHSTNFWLEKYIMNFLSLSLSFPLSSFVCWATSYRFINSDISHTLRFNPMKIHTHTNNKYSDWQ